MRDFEEIVKIATAFLNENKIPYMAVGAISVSYYGNPRSTHDVDLIVVFNDETIEKFAEFMNKNDFYVDVDDIRAALKERSHFSVLDNQSNYRLDVKGIYSDLDSETFSRRREITAYGQKIWINSPEDTIIFKLKFGSEQDFTDAEKVFMQQKGNLDRAYIEKKVKELKLEKEYKKLIKW